MRLDFCPLASGSSGNSIYLGTDDTKILIDAGLSGKKINENLCKKGIDCKNIDAIFVTHEHKDHIKGVGILSRRYDIPVYATPGTWDGMKDEIGEIMPHNIKYVYAEENCIINDICIKPFLIPHDANEPVAYNIFVDNKKATVATDLGHITKPILEKLTDSNILLLEANHDTRMLKEGPYPYYLKERILGKFGHISNVIAGKVLREIFNSKLTYVYLGHLSEQNNVPKLAFDTVKSILEKEGIIIGRDINIEMASRYEASTKVEV